MDVDNGSDAGSVESSSNAKPYYPQQMTYTDQTNQHMRQTNQHHVAAEKCSQVRHVAAEKCSQVSPIDLSLATSYLPGIYSLLKVFILLSSLHLLEKLDVRTDQAVIVCIAFLYVDRCVSIRHILDTGACAVCVLISICVNASRTEIRGETGTVNLVISIAWACVSTIILLDYHQRLLRYVSVPGIVHIVSSVFCVVHGFLAMDLEMDAVKYTRGMTFGACCILWIYTLNLTDLRTSRHDSFSSCVDRFAVVLVADQYICVGYVGCALVTIAWKHRSAQTPSVQIAEVQASDHGLIERGELHKGGFRNGGEAVGRNTGTADVEYPYPESEEMDVHMAFRMAQENARKGNHAR